MTRILPTLKQLRYLVAVADYRHFSRAADACFVTQSTLSAAIRELENLLDAGLVERTKRTVRLTPLGDETVACARAILRDVEDMVDAVTASHEPLSGELRLGVIPTIGPYLLPRVLSEVYAAHPHLRLYLREDQTAPLLERLVSGDLDVLLLALPYETGVETAILADDPFWLVAPRQHPLAERERITPGDLVGEELLLLEDGHCLRDHALSACRLEGVKRPEGFQATSLTTLVQMVSNGLGLTLLPKMALDAGILTGTATIARPLEGHGASRHVGLAWRRSSSRKEEFETLGAYFADELASADAALTLRASGV